MAVVDPAQLEQWMRIDAADLNDQELLCAAAEVVFARNVLGGMAARVIAMIEARGLVENLGFTSTAAWLTHSGLIDPGAARRQVGVARALEALPLVAEQLRSGDISPEHAESVVAAIDAIDEACPDLPDSGRAAVEMELAEVASRHAPVRVREKGRELLAALRPDEESATDDPALNRLHYGQTRGGRGVLRGNLDRLSFEKLRAALEPLSAPRPGIDGAHDPRGAEQRHADALTDVLDAYLGRGAGPGVGGGKPQVTLIAEAQELTGRGRFVHDLTERREDGSEPDASEYQDLFDSPWPFRLSWTGSVSRQVAQLLACDSDVTVVVVDANRVPLDVGRTERLVTKPIRNALIVRDEGCAMPGCGRPPGWCDAHHVIPWMNGGDTSLSNMVLLCRHHHRLVHKGGWQLQIGSDGHPWFIPPVSVDRRRRPLPAHNRQHTGSAGEAA